MGYLNPDLFEWTNYCGTVEYNWYCDVLINDKFSDNFEVIGYTNTRYIKVRPSEDTFIAFMLYDKETGTEVWGHVPIYALEMMGLITEEDYQEIALSSENEIDHTIKILEAKNAS